MSNISLTTLGGVRETGKICISLKSMDLFSFWMQV